jgi:hypothetical protein
MGSVNNAIRAIILALVGCLPSSAWSQVSIQDKTNVVVLKQAPARPAGTAVALLASAPTDRPCEELCILSGTGGQTIMNAKTGAELVGKMKVAALECGADAMIVRSMSDQTWKPFRGGIDQGSRAEAVAIRYLDDPAGTPSDEGRRD